MNRDGTFFYTRSGCVSCLRACLGTRLLPQSHQYPNLSEGTDGVGGQLRGDKECPFSGLTKSGRVWRKVPESDAQSVTQPLTRLGEGGREAARGRVDRRGGGMGAGGGGGGEGRVENGMVYSGSSWRLSDSRSGPS